MKRDYLSSSALKSFAKSPNHYIEYVTGKKETTPAMLFGSAFHCWILEPKEFAKRYAVAPKVDRRTKAGKEVWNAFVEGSKDMDVLTQQDMGLILDMHARIREHAPAQKIIDDCTSYELMIDGTIADVTFRGIADGLSDSYIVDLKTCQDASPEAFQRTAYQSFYHEQAAAYQLLFGVQKFYWIAIEKNAPYNVAVYQQSQDAFMKAKHHLESLVRQWDAWDGKPQSYGNEVFMLNLPKWAQ